MAISLGDGVAMLPDAPTEANAAVSRPPEDECIDSLAASNQRLADENAELRRQLRHEKQVTRAWELATLAAGAVAIAAVGAGR